jgi:glutamine synthetase
MQFLVFCAAVIRAVHKYGSLLRAVVAHAGNDHRLGANEAPPAIISVFLGNLLTKICDEIEAKKITTTNADKVVMELGLSHLPTLLQDNTDRNRTSPFAFTGNKFEFRAVGSSANTAFPVTVLNTAVADGMKEVTARLKAAGATGNSKDAEKMFDVIREVIKETKAIRFEGNGYSEEWVKEAEKRGLPNLRKSPEAMKELVAPVALKALSEHGVLSEEEAYSRFNVRLERYIKNLQIEVDCLRSMVNVQILPACFAYHATLSQGVAAAKAAGFEAPQVGPLKSLTEWITKAQSALSELNTIAKKAEDTHDEYKKAQMYALEVSSAMFDLRSAIDELEGIVIDDAWPLPKYREMLFIS